MGTPMARHITTVHLPKIQKADSCGQAHYNTTSSQNTKSPLLWPSTLQHYIFPKYKKPTPVARHITTLHLPKIQKAHSYAQHITTVHLPKIQKAHSYGQAHYNTTSSQNTKSPLLRPNTLQKYIFPKYKKPTPTTKHITKVHLPKIQKAHSYDQAHYKSTSSQNTKSPLLRPNTLQKYIFPKYKKPTPTT